MKRFIVILLCIMSSSLHASPLDFFEGLEPPIVVLIQTNPWAMVIGADTPLIAVYEDGTVLFLKRVGEREIYHRKNLSATELSAFRERLKPATDLKNLKRFYSLHPQGTDQPETQFYFRDGSRELTTRIYGLRAATKNTPTFPVSPGKQEPDAVPDELIELHRFLCAVDYSDSKEWTPRYVEVMAWPYEYAPDTSIVWPKDWPGLNSGRSFKRGDSYSIFLDGSLLPDLQKFLQTRKEKGAIEIGGKKWAVSYRYTFPGEPMWRMAFYRKEEK